MLNAIIASSETGSVFLQWVETATLFVEALAVLIIFSGVVVALARYVIDLTFRRGTGDRYQQLKVRLAKVLILSLEVLVAADIIRTVALDATLETVAVLGLLVLIRTFLSWALVVEIEGRWPWRKA
jgi:uncharacterized membrane protein